MFEKFSAAPADPILGLASLFIRDQRSNKINLGIGVYKDKRGETPILNCVKKAEQYLLNNERSKNYLGIAGAPQFSQVTQALIFGDNSPLIKANRVRTAHTPGGTGALRVCADVLVRTHEVKRIWVSDPSWPNHHSIFKAAGLEVCQYPYYDTQTHTFDFEAMLACLENVAATDAVLFHGCCHNPTGIDPTCEQWQKLAELALNKGWLPVFDLAYQGFGLGLDEDALGLRIFAETVPEMLVASSYSKNFGLYNERVGAFNLIAADSDIADRAFSQTLAIIRANYSTPPTHGGAIVSIILSDQALKDEWLEELTNMRHRIYRMRQLFVKTLKEKGADKDFSFISQQKGMFSFSGLSAEQVLKLRNDYGIYIVGSGRINVAGMTVDNMPLLCESIVNVL